MSLDPANKSKQLYGIMKQRISSGFYTAGEKLPSIRNLADDFDTSKTTVNRVLAMLTTEKLLEVREGMGTFVTKETSRPKQIGVMIFDFQTNMRVDTDILSSIQKNVRPGYFLSLVDTSNDFQVFCEGLRNLIDIGVSGLIVIPPKLQQPLQPKELDYLKSILNDDVPVVFVVRNIESIRADFFSMDLSKGIYKAFQHFAETGKKTIALVKHDSDKFVNEEMIGFREACLEYGIPFNDKYFIDWNNDIAVLKERLSEIIDEIDGLIVPDNVIYQMQDLIFACGKQIPQQLSIVAINDTVYSKMFNPPLTSITFPTEQIGRYAINTVIDRIEKQIDSKMINYNFEPEFVVRHT